MRKLKRIITLALSIISVFAIATPALAAKVAVSGTRYITSANGGAVNVRTGPGTSYSLAAIGTMSVGTQVTLKYQDTATDGTTWYDVVNSSNNGGWVRSDFLTTTNPGSGGGGSTNFTTGNFVKVVVNSAGVNVRKTASTSQSAIGLLMNGTKLICEGTSGSFVKVKWGGRTQDSAYISQDYLVDAGAPPSSKKDKAIAIAESMAGTGYFNGSNFDMATGQPYCVTWASFVMKAAGCTKYPDFYNQADVSGAINFFSTSGNGDFGLRANKTPKIGDWVMYSNTKTGEQKAHVGLVVGVSGSNITTVEGNVTTSHTVAKYSSFNYNNGRGDFIVYGFASPSWV